jgi:Zn ribbon nucleic-acid-binding protein
MAKKECTISITKGLKNAVDNYALQMIVQMLEKVSLGDDIVNISLNKCPYCSKQRISLSYNDEKELAADVESERCVFCDNSIDEKLLTFMLSDNEQVICLTSEMEKMLAEK